MNEIKKPNIAAKFISGTTFFVVFSLLIYFVNIRILNIILIALYGLFAITNIKTAKEYSREAATKNSIQIYDWARKCRYVAIYEIFLFVAMFVVYYLRP